VGECFFWCRPTRVVPDQRPLNSRCCCCQITTVISATGRNRKPGSDLLPRIKHHCMPHILWNVFNSYFKCGNGCITPVYVSVSLSVTTWYLNTIEHRKRLNGSHFKPSLKCKQRRKTVSVLFQLACHILAGFERGYWKCENGQCRTGKNRNQPMTLEQSNTCTQLISWLQFCHSIVQACHEVGL